MTALDSITAYFNNKKENKSLSKKRASSPPIDIPRVNNRTAHKNEDGRAISKSLYKSPKRSHNIQSLCHDILLLSLSPDEQPKVAQSTLKKVQTFRILPTPNLKPENAPKASPVMGTLLHTTAPQIGQKKVGFETALPPRLTAAFKPPRKLPTPTPSPSCSLSAEQVPQAEMLSLSEKPLGLRLQVLDLEKD